MTTTTGEECEYCKVSHDDDQWHLCGKMPDYTACAECQVPTHEDDLDDVGNCEYCAAARAEGPTICEWFAACDQMANGVGAHPILGELPVCARCAELCDLDWKDLRTD